MGVWRNDCVCDSTLRRNRAAVILESTALTLYAQNYNDLISRASLVVPLFLVW